MIVRSFEQQGLRDAIAEMKVKAIVEQSNGQIQREQIMNKRADSLSAADIDDAEKRLSMNELI